VGRTYPTFKNDDTPDQKTEMYINREMVCVNPKCDNFAGHNLGKPKKIVTTISNLEYKAE
jgi:hypothetical protein